MWMLALGMAAYVGYQMIPAQLQASELKKYMISLAEHQAEEPIEKLRAAVLGRAKDIGLPVDKKALHVERQGGRIIMRYGYSVPINLVVTTYEWRVRVEIDRLIVIA